METVQGYLGPLRRHRIVNCGRVLRVEKSAMNDRHLLIPVDLFHGTHPNKDSVPRELLQFGYRPA